MGFGGKGTPTTSCRPWALKAVDRTVLATGMQNSLSLRSLSPSAHLGSSGAPPPPVSSTRAVPHFPFSAWDGPSGSLCCFLSTNFGELISQVWSQLHHVFFPGCYLPYADWFSVSWCVLYLFQLISFIGTSRMGCFGGQRGELSSFSPKYPPYFFLFPFPFFPTFFFDLSWL